MRARLLVVDDDPLLLAGIVRLLAPLEMATAATTGEALDLVTRHPFDAVLTDFRVPTTDGIVLLRQIAVARPATRRYLMSGTAPEEFEPHLASALVHRMFRKPLDVSALRGELATLGPVEA